MNHSDRLVEGRGARKMTGIGREIVFWIGSTVVTGAALQSASDYVSRGMQRFRDNNIVGSLQDFQRAAELDPRARPHLWQRGISYYYAGQFRKGRQLFELHQRVNPHDVENAAWHFLCVAAGDGIAAARKSLFKIDTARDTRIPMS